MNTKLFKGVLYHLMHKAIERGVLLRRLGKKAVGELFSMKHCPATGWSANHVNARCVALCLIQPINILVVTNSNGMRLPAIKSPQATLLSKALLKSTFEERRHQTPVKLHVLFAGMQTGIEAIDSGKKRVHSIYL